MILSVLEQDIPGITARVRALDSDVQRALAHAAARLALLVTPVDDPRLGLAWSALDSRSEEVRSDAAQQLQQLVDDLDDLAADFQIELDEIQASGAASERSPLLEAGYDRAFTQARACEALVAALEPAVDEAVAGALYEANAALDHAPAAIGALVDAVADGVPHPVEVARQVARG